MKKKPFKKLKPGYYRNRLHNLTVVYPNGEIDFYVPLLDGYGTLKPREYLGVKFLEQRLKLMKYLGPL